MHVDDFIDDFDSNGYASWFFFLNRLPAILKTKFKDIIKNFELYCTYEDKVYRVVGCSRLGDIWINSDLTKDTVYEYRVNLEECSNWSQTADGSSKDIVLLSDDFINAFIKSQQD